MSDPAATPDDPGTIDPDTIDPDTIDPDMIDPGQIDTDLIERDLRDVEIALDALQDGTYWTADTAPDAPAGAMSDPS